MRQAQIILLDHDQRRDEGPDQKALAERLPPFWRERWHERGWTVRTTRQADTARTWLATNVPSILVVKLRRFHATALGLLAQLHRLLPDVASVVWFDAADVPLADWCGDLGVRVVLVGRDLWDELDDFLVAGMADQVQRMHAAEPGARLRGVSP
jgi:hypothetical protein